METKPSDAQVDRRSLIESFLKDVSPTPWTENGLSDRMKVARIQKHFESIMKILGLNLSDDSLKDTPLRLAKMYVHELFSGLTPDTFPKITCIDNSMKVNQMVTVSSIRFLSVCEHHFVPIDGYATVAYIPDMKVIGLSKINRVVEYFSRRPQVQERLTMQVAKALENILETEDVAVHMKAKHYCVISRGVQDTESETTTTELRGRFKSDAVARSEFLRTTKR